MAGSTFSGPLTITDGLVAGTVTGNAMAAGAVTGRALGTGAGGPLFAFVLDAVRGTHAAASGTIQQDWSFVAPNRATFLREINTIFRRGGSAPQGGNWRFKMWSNGVSKGLAATAIAGATFANVPIRGLTATLPARALVALAIHTVGATVAGGGGRPTVYLSYR